MNVPQLLAKLYEELIEAHGEIENFSSFLRVCCGRYLTLQLAGDVPRDPARPIRDLDAEGILRREAARLAEASAVRAARRRAPNWRGPRRLSSPNAQARARSNRQSGRIDLIIISSARFWRPSTPTRTPSRSTTQAAGASC